MATGFVPSRTSVTTAEGGTIPAATTAAAGVMTAEHARQLETLWKLHQQGGSAPVLFAPEPPRPVAIDLTSFREAVAQLGQRVARIEATPRQLIAHAPLPTDPVLAGPDYGPRIEAVEQQLRTIVEAFDAFAALVDERLTFIERTALGQITVKAE